MKTIEEVLKPYYKQNKGGLDEWIDYEDAQKAMIEYAREVIDTIVELGDGDNGLIYCEKENYVHAEALYNYEAIEEFKNQLK